MGLTLGDLRQPDFGGRVWGYDRDEVDRLLAAVVTSIERMQRRRQRDAAAIDKATAAVGEANARAERAERERDELAARLETALHSSADGHDDDDYRDALAEAERQVAEARQRAERAERQVLGLRQELSEQRERFGRIDEGDYAGYDHLPLAQRAARALLRDARARAAAIVAEAEGRSATP